MAQQLTFEPVAQLPSDVPAHIGKLVLALTQRFPDAIFDAEPFDLGEGWRVAVVSCQFDGLDFFEPADMVWNVAKGVLTDQELFATNILPIGTAEFGELQNEEAT